MTEEVAPSLIADDGEDDEESLFDSDDPDEEVTFCEDVEEVTLLSVVAVSCEAAEPLDGIFSFGSPAVTSDPAELWSDVSEFPA